MAIQNERIREYFNHLADRGFGKSIGVEIGYDNSGSHMFIRTPRGNSMAISVEAHDEGYRYMVIQGTSVMDKPDGSGMAIYDSGSAALNLFHDTLSQMVKESDFHNKGELAGILEDAKRYAFQKQDRVQNYLNPPKLP